MREQLITGRASVYESLKTSLPLIMSDVCKDLGENNAFTDLTTHLHDAGNLLIEGRKLQESLLSSQENRE